MRPRLRFGSWGLLAFTALWLLFAALALPQPLELAAQFWPFVLVGLVGAIIGNATAIGGGLVFVPVMILFYGFSPVESLKIALLAQAFGMTSGAIAWAKRGEVPSELLKTTIPAMLLGASLASLVIRPSALLIKGLFGPVAIVLGLLVLMLVDRHGESEEVPPSAAGSLAIAAFLGGMISGWVAVGVGEVVAAYLMVRHGFRTERAIALGVVLLAVGSIYLALIHGFYLGGLPWEVGSFVVLGCVFGARLGPYLSQWIGTRALKKIFAFIAIADGLLFVGQLLT